MDLWVYMCYTYVYMYVIIRIVRPAKGGSSRQAAPRKCTVTSQGLGTYIYIYISRERERERDDKTCVIGWRTTCFVSLAYPLDISFRWFVFSVGVCRAMNTRLCKPSGHPPWSSDTCSVELGHELYGGWLPTKRPILYYYILYCNTLCYTVLYHII